jgi:hypothetical protein
LLHLKKNLKSFLCNSFAKWKKNRTAIHSGLEQGGSPDGYRSLFAAYNSAVEPGGAEANDPGTDITTKRLHQERRQGRKTESRGQDS